MQDSTAKLPLEERVDRWVGEGAIGPRSRPSTEVVGSANMVDVVVVKVLSRDGTSG